MDLWNQRPFGYIRDAVQRLRLATDLLSVFQVVKSFVFLHVIKVIAIKTARRNWWLEHHRPEPETQTPTVSTVTDEGPANLNKGTKLWRVTLWLQSCPMCPHILLGLVHCGFLSVNYSGQHVNKFFSGLGIGFLRFIHVFAYVRVSAHKYTQVPVGARRGCKSPGAGAQGLPGKPASGNNL